MSAHSQPHLVAGGQLGRAESVRRKVEQDIAFLQDRIESLQSHPRPNLPVIETYQTMLSSRRSVLRWLEHGRLVEPVPRLNDADCPGEQAS